MMLWLTETMLMTTLLMALVLLVRRPVARAFGPHAAYALWSMPAARAVLPVLPNWDPWLMPGGGRVVVAPDEGLVGIVNPALEVSAGTDWALVLGLGWAAGALVFAGVQAWRYRRFMRAALAGATSLTRIAEIDVVMSRAVAGPMAAGIWRRRILLPADFKARYSADERRLALLHEGAHHDRRDLWANSFGLGVLALHWWNPVAHMAWRAFRADQELACDATVLAGADGDVRAAYATAVLKSATPRTPAAACAMNQVSQLKERLSMMKRKRMSRVRGMLGGLVVALATATGLAATASGAQPAPPAPPAPVAPAAPSAAIEAPAPPLAPAAGRRVVIVTQGPTDKPSEARGKRVPMSRRIVIRDLPGGEPIKIDEAVLEREIETAMAGMEDIDAGVTMNMHEVDGRRAVIIRHAREAAIAAADAHEIAKEARAEAAREIAEARAEIVSDADMPSDVRRRVLAALDRALGEVRAGQR